ncbi:MAG TPA: Hsp20/alpha crystallin family protein, partial [Vulgatibacter sp.]
KEIVLELRGDILSLQAEHDGLRYQKELLLPRSYAKDQLHASCRNGLLEIRMAGEGGGVQ